MLKVGERAPHSRIYTCTICGHRSAMLHGEKVPACPECESKNQKWKMTKHVILLTTKNIAKEVAEKSTLSEKVSDKITAFCGSMPFVYIHAVWFTAWIWYNLVVVHPFDPYPFGFLTLIVSLEAIVLATFILVSQNREGLVNALRNEADYQIDMKAAKMLAEIRALVSELKASKPVRRKSSRKTRR